MKPHNAMMAAMTAALFGSHWKPERAPKIPKTEEDFKAIAFAKERHARKQRERQQRREAQQRKL